MVLELNHCIEVRTDYMFGTLACPISFSTFLQEILRANAYIKTAADLSTKYQKNVQYNLEATRENKPEGSVP